MALTGLLHHAPVSHASAQHGSHSSKRQATSSATVRTRDTSDQTLYVGRHFTIALPKGWIAGKREQDEVGEIESTWTDNTEPNTELLIDFSPASDLSLEQDAAPVHDGLIHQADYRELYYGSGDLRGIASWMWIFRGPELEHVDYFFVRYSTAFALLGSSPANHFDRMDIVFRVAAESVRARCQ